MDNKYIFHDDYVIPRSSRKLKYDSELKTGIIFSFLFVVIIFFATLLALPSLSKMSLEAVLDILSLRDKIQIAHSSIWDFTDYFVLSIKHPSRIACIYTAIITTALMVILMLVKCKSVASPISITLTILASPLAVFAILFIFLPKWYSFDPCNMSDLLTTVSSLIVLGMPVFLWFLLIPVPLSFEKRIGCFILFDIILYILYFLKHFIFLMVFMRTNALLVPHLFLFCLTLWDLLWVNVFYSFVVSRVSKKLDNNTELWSKR